VTNHFIKRLNLREQLIREVEIIPLEVVCRNIVAGSMSQRLGIEEGTPLPRSIIEFYYKNDQLNDPMVSEEHITAFGWATPQEIDDIMALAATPTETTPDFMRQVLTVRLRTSEMALDAAQSALLHAGSRGYLQGSPVNRRLRESYFVAIITPSIRHLRKELARLSGEAV
jgi:phosphoribosylaminoimidazole-succinocarboxamide synthase